MFSSNVGYLSNIFSWLENALDLSQISIGASDSAFEVQIMHLINICIINIVAIII